MSAMFTIRFGLGSGVGVVSMRMRINFYVNHGSYPEKRRPVGRLFTFLSPADARSLRAEDFDHIVGPDVIIVFKRHTAFLTD